MLVLKNLAQVVTLAGDPPPRRGESMRRLGVIEGGAVVVRGERIAWVGRTHDLPRDETRRDWQVVDGLGLELVALPGFVDSHTHPVFAGTRAAEYEARSEGRTYQEIAAAGGGIRTSTRQLREATADHLVSRVEGFFRKFLGHGTTTIEAKSGYGLSVEDEVKSLEVLAALGARSRLEVVPTFMGAHDVPDEHRASRRDYVRQIIEVMIPRVAGARLARYCDVFCDSGYFTVDEARAILEAARAAGLGIRIHAEELAASGGARLAAELKAASADHLDWVGDEDIAALARAGTVATLLPGVPFNLGLGRYAPARRLIASGVPVALATDFNPGSCPTLNMQIILSIACSQMKMTPAEAITAATINAACSLDLADRVGSIEPGKQADIVLMDVADYRELPYFFGVNHCVMTIKKGNIVVNRLEGP
ncbi:MAG: imidazolonepropionase [Acidobacteria bacterium]|nr:MAG: imidazolonepropionase [Acidobacteriota bacterium]